MYMTEKLIQNKQKEQMYFSYNGTISYLIPIDWETYMSLQHIHSYKTSTHAIQQKRSFKSFLSWLEQYVYILICSIPGVAG